MFSDRNHHTVRPSPRIGRRPLLIESLEPRQLLATLISPTIVRYQDRDGDVVQVRLTQPLLTAANVNDIFHFSAGEVSGSNAARQALETIDLTALGARPGLSLAVEVLRPSRLGDGVASVGLIDATGLSLGSVRVSGDLGAIVAGNFDLRSRSIATVVNEILARYDDNRDGQINFNTSDFAGVEITDPVQQTNTFSRMDEDFSGRVTRTEISNFLSRDIDTNSNGQLTTLELNGYIARDPENANILLTRRGIDSLSVRSLGETSKLPRSITAAVDEVFRRYDKNSDTRIDLNPAAGELSGGDPLNTFSRMDSNIDNRVTRPELATYLSRAVDNNSDNFLSTLEFSYYQASAPEESATLFGNPLDFPRRLTTAAAAILRQYDTNGDGQINLDQTIEQREVSTAEELNVFSSMDEDFSTRVTPDELRAWIDGNVDADSNGIFTTAELSLFKVQDPTAFNVLFSTFLTHIKGDVTRLEIRQHLIGVTLAIEGSLRDGFIAGSILNASLGALDVAENLVSLRVNGDVNGQIHVGRDLTSGVIGGSLVGDSNDGSGQIFVQRDLKSLYVGRDIVGGTGVSPVSSSDRATGAVIVKRTLTSLYVGRDLLGGNGTGTVPTTSGYIEARTMGAVTIGRDVKSGAGTFTGIQAAETIGTLTIGRDIVGRADNQVTITAGGQPLTLARAAEDILKRYDKNKNGVIDLAQNLAKREVTTPEQINTFSGMDEGFDARTTPAELRKWLSSNIDADFDGVLTPVELAAFQLQDPGAFQVLFGAGGPSTPLADIAAQILRRYDANRDNRIDLRQNIARKEVTPGAELNTFAQMDSNFDAFVTSAEVVAYLAGGVDLDSDLHLIPLEGEDFALNHSETFAVLFTAPGIDLVSASGLTDLAIGRLVVGRDMIQTIIAAGYDISGTPLNGDAQIGTILVGCDWIASSALAGVSYPDGTPAIELSLPGILSRINTIIIGRRLADGPLATVIAAQEIRRLLIRGRWLPLQSGPHNDDLPLTAGGLARLLEAG